MPWEGEDEWYRASWAAPHGNSLRENKQVWSNCKTGTIQSAAASIRAVTAAQRRAARAEQSRSTSITFLVLSLVETGHRIGAAVFHRDEFVRISDQTPHDRPQIQLPARSDRRGLQFTPEWRRAVLHEWKWIPVWVQWWLCADNYTDILQKLTRRRRRTTEVSFH